MNFKEIIQPSLTGHVLIVAPTGAGKSYFVGALIEQLHYQHKPYIIMDTKSQNHLGLWIGKNRLKKLNLLRIFPDTSLSIDDYMKIVQGNPYLLCIPAGITTLDHLIDEYKKILTAIQYLRIPRHVIVEETHHYTTSPQKAIGEIEWIVREGRGYGIWLWSITQRMSSFPKDVWSNGMWTYIFRMRIPQDIEYFKKTIPEFEELNDNLNDYDVLQYDQLRKNKPPHHIIRAAQVKRKTEHLG